MSQRISDASARNLDHFTPCPGYWTTSFRPLSDNLPDFLESQHSNVIKSLVPIRPFNIDADARLSGLPYRESRPNLLQCMRPFMAHSDRYCAATECPLLGA
jgi:hypothetical protein